MEVDEIAPSVADFYDACAVNYSDQYERDALYDTSQTYPANYFRLQILLNSFVDKGLKRVIEIGVGEGTPLLTLAKSGMDVHGFDISHEMVKKSKENMKKFGLNPENISWGDIQDPNTYIGTLKDGQFDGLLAMGVMPHVKNDSQALANMRSLVKPGGSVFIEFRNKLFSMFTFNRFTYEFIMDDLLAGVSPKLRETVSKDLKNRLEMDKPALRDVHYNDDEVHGYDSILSKYHNPFEMTSMFNTNGFSDIKLHWYHYHPAMPFLQGEDEALFRKESINLEHDPDGWRGYFLCSAFVVEAVRAE